MHPPLNIIDQTDELIAIEWLRENGYSTYADHMECKPEGMMINNHISFQIWISMRHESVCETTRRKNSISFTESRERVCYTSGSGSRAGLREHSTSETKTRTYLTSCTMSRHPSYRFNHSVNFARLDGY